MIKKSTNNKCWKGCREKRTLTHCWECKLVQPLWKIVWSLLKKLKIGNSLVVQWLVHSTFTAVAWFQFLVRELNPANHVAWQKKINLKIQLLHNSAIPFLEIYPEKTKTLIWKDTCTPVYRSIIYNNQDMEATQVSINRWLDLEDVVYI